MTTMKTPIKPTYVAPDRIRAIAESLGLFEDSYSNKDRKVEPFNQYTFYGRPYGGYEFRVNVRTARHRRAPNMLVRLREYETDEEITAKLRKLQVRAENGYREQLAEEAEQERQQQEFESREKEWEKTWIGAVRYAFGNAPDQPLEGATLPKVLTKQQLVHARVSEDLTIKLPPFDPFLKDKNMVDRQRTLRAGFLAELDRLLASYKNEVLAS